MGIPKKSSKRSKGKMWWQKWKNALLYQGSIQLKKNIRTSHETRTLFNDFTILWDLTICTEVNKISKVKIWLFSQTESQKAKTKNLVWTRKTRVHESILKSSSMTMQSKSWSESKWEINMNKKNYEKSNRTKYKRVIENLIWCRQIHQNKLLKGFIAFQRRVDKNQEF